MSLLAKYEKKKRLKYKLTEKQKEERDKKIEEQSVLLIEKKEEDNKEEEEEETEEQKELREIEEGNVIEILKKYILEENREAEEIRRLLNKKTELFQNVKTTFIFDTMLSLFNTKLENSRKIAVQRTNFLL